MRVDDRNLTSVPAPEPGRAQDAQRTGREDSLRSVSGSGTESGGGDHVELSSTLGSLSNAMSEYGSDRASRVASLGAQYQAGTYQTNSLATSQGIVSEALAAGIT